MKFYFFYQKIYLSVHINACFFWTQHYFTIVKFPMLALGEYTVNHPVLILLILLINCTEIKLLH